MEIGMTLDRMDCAPLSFLSFFQPRGYLVKTSNSIFSWSGWGSHSEGPFKVFPSGSVCEPKYAAVYGIFSRSIARSWHAVVDVILVGTNDRPFSRRLCWCFVNLNDVHRFNTLVTLDPDPCCSIRIYPKKSS